MSIAYYNGKIGKREELSVPLTDRALWFGDGVYDAAVGRGGKIYMEKEHLERFYRNMHGIGLADPMRYEDLFELLERLVRVSECDGGFFLYFQATREGGVRQHAYGPNAKTNLLVTVDPWEMSDEPISLTTYPDLRYRYCDRKTLNILPSVLAAADASRKGAGEAVFQKNNKVTECSRSNISILKNGILYTHPEGEEILAGIARGLLIDACRSYQIPVEERPFSVREMQNADEIFVTSTSKFAVRANELDGQPVGMKDEKNAAILCEKLRSDFLKAMG